MSVCLHCYCKFSTARKNINMFPIIKPDSWPHYANALPPPEISAVTCCKPKYESRNYYRTWTQSISPGLKACQSFCMIKCSFNFLSFNNRRIAVQSICKSRTCAFDICEMCSCQNLSFLWSPNSGKRTILDFLSKAWVFCCAV